MDSFEKIIEDFDKLLLKNVDEELYCDRMTFSELRKWQRKIQEINDRLHKCEFDK